MTRLQPVSELKVKMNSKNDSNNFDLHLLSNNDKILVCHYVLDLTCDMEEKCFSGSILLICRPLLCKSSQKEEGVLSTSPCGSDCNLNEKKSESSHLSDDYRRDKQSPNVSTSCFCTPERQEFSEDFSLVLDSSLFQVSSVNEIVVGKECNVNSLVEAYSGVNCDLIKLKDVNLMDLKSIWKSAEKISLRFQAGVQSVQIWKQDIICPFAFPQLIEVNYHTSPSGESIKWTKSQDEIQCVFTHGHYLNNRSLFPSQDVPGAMATWHAHISCQPDYTVLMTGDDNPTVSQCDSGLKTYSFSSSIVMPSSTLALAVGSWKQKDIITQTNKQEFSTVEDGNVHSEKLFPCRLFSPEKHFEKAVKLLGSYVPKCLEASYDVLGQYPFRRLDILVVPDNFPSLGMASPSLMFLSQSVLSDDGEMLVRFAHELSHTWFGLVIGARDWHEEWISEGFATYMEDVFHAQALKKSTNTFMEERQLHDYLKYKVLLAELENSPSDLHHLREEIELESIKVVKNGMNPDKTFLQLHYIKGYFLLRYLEDQTGLQHFLQFMQRFVNKFSQQLILSKDVLDLFFQEFPELRSEDFNSEVLFRDWLNTSALPMAVTKYGTLDANPLMTLAHETLQKIEAVNATYKTLHWRKRRKLDIDQMLALPKLTHVQMLVFLDKLLRMERLHQQLLLLVFERMSPEHSNPDVLHRWCELAVKHKLTEIYPRVADFLIHHQDNMPCCTAFLPPSHNFNMEDVVASIKM
ncbi:aminopeptidase O-like isoform X2 [Mya arenaria]|uniref:aminopeptidase O-like isoform X2 n=1 Tax=Mya arenaria TaxID=6604 RepID=UPI0022DFEDFB|nr:aminopeptidase O-like isoform X2 [Mya arenaria]XP_052774365.1 aminopeptidase O-like isoform X2 [Mya arenaria]